MLPHVHGAFLLLLVATSQARRKDPKIFGGQDCDISKYPFYIYMEYNVQNSKFMCGGSLLTINNVLTAGHCCHGMTGATVYSGYQRTTRDHDQTSKIVLPPTLHPNFTAATLENDICIVQLETPFKLTKRTKLVALTPKKRLREMMENDNDEKKYELQLMGYGVNKRDGRSFAVDDKKPFQCTNSLLRTQKKCVEMMKDPAERAKYSKETMFCHYNPLENGTKGSCEGDSGSPILYGNMQVGLISWGPNEETCTERMEVSARLDAAYDWIKQTAMAVVPKKARGDSF